MSYEIDEVTNSTLWTIVVLKNLTGEALKMPTNLKSMGGIMIIARYVLKPNRADNSSICSRGEVATDQLKCTGDSKYLMKKEIRKGRGKWVSEV